MIMQDAHATATILVPAPWGRHQIMDGITAYLDDLSEAHADTAMQWMRDEVDARLPDGWTWHPHADSIYCPYHDRGRVVVDIDDVFEAASASTRVRIDALIQ